MMALDGDMCGRRRSDGDVAKGVDPFGVGGRVMVDGCWRESGSGRMEIGFVGMSDEVETD
jgi:hypothetical protein